MDKKFTFEISLEFGIMSPASIRMNQKYDL